MKTFALIGYGAFLACVGMVAANTHLTVTKYEAVERTPGIAEQPVSAPAKPVSTYQVVMTTCGGPDAPQDCRNDTITYDLSWDDCGKALHAYVAPENGFLACEPWKIIQPGN